MRDFEVLAPAGDLEIFKSVIDAGADAVYFGGKHFSARAYANNFDYEESKEALKYAHLHNKKAYLTLNTLIKNKEFDDDLYNYIRFYYENGLDGIIVQDIGLIKYIREVFPDLNVHGSTQLAVCNSYGVSLFEKLGVTRIVPARELSLEEIRTIYDNTKIELEVFVHGALCYCYSGDCLMSSLIGGRSGNRGRCAQPCRLEYDVYNGKNRLNSRGGYVLSLKDLCGINDLDKLYRSGVTSLKIEGRMKKKQYACNVVNIYRRYVDLLLNNLSKGIDSYEVSDKDKNLLLDLGNRCGFTNSYYYGKKDRMVTFESPSHENKDVSYCFEEMKIPVKCKFTARINEPIELVVAKDDIKVNLKGVNCEIASNKPVNISDIDKRLNKTGNTSFYFDEIEHDIDNNIFIPLGDVNRLRKEALDLLEEKILYPFKRNIPDIISTQNIQSVDNKDSKEISDLIISIQNTYQLDVLSANKSLKNVDLVISLADIKDFIDIERIRKMSVFNNIFVEFPTVIRKESKELLEQNVEIIRKYDGYIVSSYDGMEFIRENKLKGVVISGSYIYTFNNNSIRAIRELGIDYNIAPYELNYKELSHRNNSNSIITIYGKYPMMVTNNCINKNCLKCDKTQKSLTLKDKKGHSFLVRNLCNVCYNVIYNENVTYLLDERKKLSDIGFNHFVMNFVDEDKDLISSVINDYYDSFGDNMINIKYKYTKGHFKRGVE